MERKYLAVIEKADDGGYSAYVPDLPECVSSGEPVPEPTTRWVELTTAV